MSRSRSIAIACAILIIAQPCIAVTGVPDPSESTASIAYTGPGTPSLMVVPDGSGPRFTAAHDEQGNVVNATITLFVRDGAGYPIMGFPREDMWIETAAGGMTSCFPFAMADQNTDATGMTMWANPLLAGGQSQGPVLVFLAGSPLISNAGLPLKINSPDINGDRVVNLQDVAILSGDFYSGYNFRCDLNGDGVINLADIPIFALHYAAQCP